MHWRYLPRKTRTGRRTVHGRPTCSNGAFVILLLLFVIASIRILLLVLLHLLVILLLQFCRLFLKWCPGGVGQGLPLLSTFFGHRSHTIADLLLNRRAVLAQPEPVSSLWLLGLVRILVGLPRPLVCFLSLRLRLVRPPLACHASCRHESSHVFLKFCLGLCCFLLVGRLLSCGQLLPLLTPQLSNCRANSAACLFCDGLAVLAQEDPIGILGLPRFLHDGHLVSINTPGGWTSAKQGLRCL